MRFENKVVLVTGSSRGIGKAIALAFAREGAKVVIDYVKDKSAAESTVSEIKAMGRESVAVQADVSKEDQVKDLIEKVVAGYGVIDILVNNAGIVYDVPIFEKTVEQWEQTLRVNLIGSFLCAKYSVPYIREGGAIINISSSNGINTLSPESADYDASKFGLISLTKNLASELAPKIRVNCVAPGWIRTDINKGLTENYIADEMSKISMGDFGQPEDIAHAVLFLSSSEARYITGSVLVVDGGYKA